MKAGKFILDFPDKELSDLLERVRSCRWPEEELVDDWSQGVPLQYAKQLSEYWHSSYNWKDRQAYINQYPQFKVQVEGLEIHFVHVRAENEDAPYLLLSHGWPGSFLEFYEAIPYLTGQKGDKSQAFNLVIPSLPGFGFSEKPAQTGFGVEKIADLWVGLMDSLGVEQFFAQGGDWGSMITTSLAIRHPKKVTAIHLNMPIVDLKKVDMTDLTTFEAQSLKSLTFYQEWDSGYSKQQSTRPQTIGYSLLDSPVGLLTWIIEKFYQWTDCKGDPANIISRDRLLDNVMIYWIGKNGASSARIYWESFGSGDFPEISIPAGFSIYPKEIFRQSERWLKTRFKNIIYYNNPATGGHFAAMENPELFSSEIKSCFSCLEEK